MSDISLFQREKQAEWFHGSKPFASAPPDVKGQVIEQVTQAAFGQRRKMLRQSLKSVPRALDALESLGIDPTRRAETLAVDDFVAIAREIGP